MTKAVATTEQSMEKQMQKHMGCMAGFRQIFERHHIAATTKRLHYARSLPSSPATEMTTTSESEKSTPPSPPREAVVESTPPKSPLTLGVLNAGAAKSTWKFGREAPRLSLDSRAVTDSKGCLHPKDIRTTTNANVSATTDETQHHRSPSVIARLMGLEPLPPPLTSASEPELRRSSSESRASKDLFYSRFEDFSISLNGFKDKSSPDGDPWVASNLKNNIKQGAVKFQQNQQRKCFFDSGDVFPEPKKKAVSHYGEIESKLRMRGINHPSKDLETLRQILEALQLKGLLHSSDQIGHRNFVYDESPLVLVKSSKSTGCSTPINRRIGSDCSPKNIKSPKTRRSYGISGEISPAVSPRRERNISSPVRTGRCENNRLSSSLVKPKPLTVDTQRRRNDIAEKRRVSPVHSPKVYPRRTGPDQSPGNNRSPRSKKPTAEIRRKEKTAIITTTTIVEDESSSVSEYSYSTSTDTERSKTEEYKDGRNLLERCSKLLHSIAEMTSTDMQPSPVSVLDYKDELFTPSPVTTRRKIEFKDHHSGEVEDDPWSPLISPMRSKYEEEEASQDSDFTYISDILRASHYLTEHSDLFSLLEKQHYLKPIDASKAKLQRKLIFDVVSEIIERNKQLPPWKIVSATNNDSIDKIWSEFRKLRDRNNSAEDLFEIVCGVLKEDLGGDASNGWGDCCVEVSDSILDIERMIFKDLISETIRDLVVFSSRSIVVSSSPKLKPRKKLVF